MAIKDYVPLNLELMAHPINWIIIVLMVAIAGLGIALITHSAAAAPVNS
jgi:hypothetical protein